MHLQSTTQLKERIAVALNWIGFWSYRMGAILAIKIEHVCHPSAIQDEQVVARALNVALMEDPACRWKSSVDHNIVILASAV